MLAAPIPSNEAERIATLRSLNILDTSPEERFDRLTRLAKRLFDMPMALVSLVDIDRQWFKSCIGSSDTEGPRSLSFCGHAILEDDIMLVPDALKDPRFHDHPLVAGGTGIRFYAGCPLRVSNGSKLGTLCLLDTKPRTLDAEERELLRDLARMAEQELIAVQLATLDPLTMLSNRRGFETLARHALDACRRLGHPASLLFFDLNDFKRINDTRGHAEGDRALVTFADVLGDGVRDIDVVARLGGDEFVALLTQVDEARSARVLARLDAALAERNRALARGYDIGYSVGRIQYDPAKHPDVAALLAEADAAMYGHKQALRAGR